jgi:hypothetical protein
MAPFQAAGLVCGEMTLFEGHARFLWIFVVLFVRLRITMQHEFRR